MTQLAIRRWDPETALVAWIASVVSVASFFYYFHRGELLLYGDAVAHINIARRVFDSRTPGLLQLGTVWLPLPHLAMIPFLVSDRLWRTGVGGSIPSMIAYVFGAVGILRLVRGIFRASGGPHNGARFAAWCAVLIYAANPNLIYLQATAMTEPIYLALFIWAVVFFADFVRILTSVDQTEKEPTSLLRGRRDHHGALPGARGEISRSDPRRAPDRQGLPEWSAAGRLGPLFLQASLAQARRRPGHEGIDRGRPRPPGE